MCVHNLLRFKKEDWVKATTEWFVQKISELLSSNQTVNIAISGGNTPLTLFNYWVVNNVGIDWQKVKIFWVDERNVDVASKESNYGNALPYLKMLKGIKLFPMFTGLPTNLEEIANKYQDVIIENTKTENNIPCFDMIVLGMGNDGHYASLFPKTKGLLETQKFVIVNWVESLQQNRLTLTNTVVQQATEVVVLINDLEKNKVLANALFFETDLPIQKIVARKKPTTWIYSI